MTNGFRKAILKNNENWSKQFVFLKVLTRKIQQYEFMKISGIEFIKLINRQTAGCNEHHAQLVENDLHYKQSFAIVVVNGAKK